MSSSVSESNCSGLGIYIDCNGRYILANVLRREEGHRSQGGPSAMGRMACPSFVMVLDYLVFLSLGTECIDQLFFLRGRQCLGTRFWF